MEKPFKIIGIGDAHHPWSDPVLEYKATQIIYDEQPDAIVQLGDLYDFFSFGRHPRAYDLIKPVDEVRRGRENAADFWRRIKLAAPDAECYQILGNHDDRIMKQVVGKFPELAGVMEDVLDFHKLWRFEGVKLIEDSAAELVIGDVVFQHGHRSKLGDHMAYNLQSTVTGHSHKGGTVFKRYRDASLYELNVGAIIDVHAPVFDYTGSHKYRNAVLGIGMIDKYGPRFIPLEGGRRRAHEAGI